LALSDAKQREYLSSVIERPVGLRCPEVEITTTKPLLIMAIITHSKPYTSEWFDTLDSVQSEALKGLEAVLALMIELGVWDLFSLDNSERENAAPYVSAWSVCRLLSERLLGALGWPQASPELSFDSFLHEYTYTVED
jgi:hypothetical protein